MRVPGFLRRHAPLQADVGVVGSGLPALAAALELVPPGREGHRPRLRPGRGAAASVSASPLLGPGRPYARVARAIGRSAARLVWAAGCENHLRLRALVEEARRDCGYVARGSFLLARDRAEAADLAESEDMLRDDGFPGEFLDHYMLETRFDLSGFPGAYWAAEDAEIDGPRLLGALGEWARAAGIGFEPGPVRARPGRGVGRDGRDRGGARARRARSWWRRTARSATSSLSFGRCCAPPPRRACAPRCSRGRSCPPPSGPPTAASPGRAGRDRCCSPGSGESGDVSAEGLEDFATRIPVDGATLRRWNEPGEVSADGMPIVGRLPGRPLAVACGFGALSPGLAFAAARWVADAVLSGSDPTPGPLRATRPPAPV